MRDHLWTPHGALVSEALDNNAFLWQPAVTLAKTTSYDPASPINALTKVDGVAQVHDGRGNRTGAAGRTWRYDSRNMLVGANAPGMAASYGYYPEGGRAWKQVNGVTTLYLELDGVEWGSYDAAGNLKERTIRASGTGGAVVAVHSPAGGLIRLLPNRQGSVIGWLRPDGTLGGAYTFDAYGNSAQAGAPGPSFRYAGMRFDVETGLYHTPNRAYDPGDGRWMQLDPIGIKDGLNRYAYVKNSPLMGVDPTGLADHCGTGTRIGGVDSVQCRTVFDTPKDQGNKDQKNENTQVAQIVLPPVAAPPLPLGGQAQIPTNEEAAKTLTRIIEKAIAKLLNGDPSKTLYHYTNKEHGISILTGGVINQNERGVVYVTDYIGGPMSARSTLFMTGSTPGFERKGDWVVVMTVPIDFSIIPLEKSQFEFIHYGSIRDGRAGVRFEYVGPNQFPEN